MRTIQFLLKKEFLQIVRNKAMLPILVIAPIIQLLILAHAASFEIKNLKVHVIDLDQSPFSRLLINKFQGSDHFELANFSFSHKIAEDDFLKDKVNLVVKIPANFEGDLINENKAKVQFIINAINGNAAGLTFVYASSILKDFNTQIMGEWINEKTFGPAAYNINYSFWFNPEMNYKTFMVPGILVMLVTMIGMLLTGMNIVREKETGTIEQINVTPIRKIHFIIGKLLPFWMIALFELAFGLLIAKLVFDIPIVGSIWLIFLFAGVYLLVVLAFGLLVSTVTDTQQQAMFISWFFMVIFILMSGLFTPIESMPSWAQIITKFNPVAYFVEVMRMVLLKGSQLVDIQKHLIIMGASGIAVLSIAISQYRKVSG